ncbi:uncharacterized protein EI90DRAFT_3132236 [Cantharellus anzutake]|uniref:uncharacterized protein n=1 Tax=Cantharellus anzutake TaxID=1750568 RepID=UPI001902F809|nr:uncharacterized protein EI90DRAFT_3132236 [Cantharellus anzutake]KAF8319881.1 hypothetical protein EI90DRAFT_3132236 [Cantharellus anzutake]
MAPDEGWLCDRCNEKGYICGGYGEERKGWYKDLGFISYVRIVLMQQQPARPVTGHNVPTSVDRLSLSGHLSVQSPVRSEPLGQLSRGSIEAPVQTCAQLNSIPRSGSGFAHLVPSNPYPCEDGHHLQAMHVNDPPVFTPMTHRPHLAHPPVSSLRGFPPPMSMQASVSLHAPPEGFPPAYSPAPQSNSGPGLSSGFSYSNYDSPSTNLLTHQERQGGHQPEAMRATSAPWPPFSSHPRRQRSSQPGYNSQPTLAQASAPFYGGSDELPPASWIAPRSDRAPGPSHNLITLNVDAFPQNWCQSQANHFQI